MVCHCHPQTIRYLLSTSPSPSVSLPALNSRPQAAILSLFMAVPSPFTAYFQSLVTTPTPFLIYKTRAYLLYSCHPRAECLSHLSQLHTMNPLFHALLHKRLPTAIPTLFNCPPTAPSRPTYSTLQSTCSHSLLHANGLTSLHSANFILFHLIRLLLR